MIATALTLNIGNSGMSENNEEMNPQIEPLLVSHNEAARLLGIDRTTFYQLCSSGRIGPMAIKFGRRSLFRLDELREWVAADCPPRVKWHPIRENLR